jgi:hypothetical protein
MACTEAGIIISFVCLSLHWECRRDVLCPAPSESFTPWVSLAEYSKRFDPDSCAEVVGLLRAASHGML